MSHEPQMNETHNTNFPSECGQRIVLQCAHQYNESRTTPHMNESRTTHKRVTDYSLSIWQCGQRIVSQCAHKYSAVPHWSHSPAGATSFEKSKKRHKKNVTKKRNHSWNCGPIHSLVFVRESFVYLGYRVAQ